MNPFRTHFDRQKSFFETNSTKSYQWRIEQLDSMERLLRENRARLEEAVSMDFKTAAQEKYFEVAAPLAVIEGTKQQLREWMTPVEAKLPEFLEKSGHKAKIFREPYGVVLVIGPFNGPLILLLDPAIAAIAAGNTCILKLSDAIPATSSLLMELIPKYFAPEVIVAVKGNSTEIGELLKLPFDFIFFTGSVKVGKVIMQAAAQNLTPVLLELGGQNPAIVDKTANLKDAAKKIVWGAMAWGGQWCTSPGYAYVDQSIVADFVHEAKEALVSLYGADPKSNGDYSRIVNAKSVRRLAALIDTNKVVSGGEFDEDARYLAPTILHPIYWSDPIMSDEIFGPILPILSFGTIEEAFSEIKKRAKPLSAFIFSQDQKIIDRFLNEVSFGGGAVNQTNVHLFIDTMPFGGVGNSGIGHYYGKAGFDSLTHAKSILISPPNVAIEHLFPPYTKEKVEEVEKWFRY